MARPPTYTNDTLVSVNSANAASKLQTASDRRAIVQTIIDKGGRMTLAQIDEHFGFDIRNSVLQLLRAGWLEVVE